MIVHLPLQPGIMTMYAAATVKIHLESDISNLWLGTHTSTFSVIYLLATSSNCPLAVWAKPRRKQPELKRGQSGKSLRKCSTRHTCDWNNFWNKVDWNHKMENTFKSLFWRFLFIFRGKSKSNLKSGKPSLKNIAVTVTLHSLHNTFTFKVVSKKCF